MAQSGDCADDFFFAHNEMALIDSPCRSARNRLWRGRFDSEHSSLESRTSAANGLRVRSCRDLCSRLEKVTVHPIRACRLLPQIRGIALFSWRPNRPTPGVGKLVEPSSQDRRFGSGVSGSVLVPFPGGSRRLVEFIAVAGCNCRPAAPGLALLPLDRGPLSAERRVQMDQDLERRRSPQRIGSALERPLDTPNPRSRVGITRLRCVLFMLINELE